MILPSGLFAWLAAGALPCAATLVGGALAFRLRAALPVLLAFSSGAVIGIALFDLLPEGLRLGSAARSPLDLMTAMAGGFALYLIADRLWQHSRNGAAGVGVHLGPFSLSLHSLTDGLSIGLALHVSSAMALVVATAVIAHDLVDGANTVTLSLAGGISGSAALRWLIVDAVAPILGVVLAQLIAPSASELGLLLAMFSGLFLYVGTCKLLPRDLPGQSLPIAAGAPALGMLFIYAIARLAMG